MVLESINLVLVIRQNYIDLTQDQSINIHNIRKVPIFSEFRITYNCITSSGFK